MAKPDCDDGWLKYAHELDAALAVADFSKGARIVLREVFAQIFGPAKAPTARLSPAEIAGRSGHIREHISRAIKELVGSGTLSCEADGSYRFTKDYESWTGYTRSGSTGTPRLTAAEVVYCKNAAAVALAYKHGYPPKKRTQMVTDDSRDRNHLGTDTVTIGVRERNHLGTDTVTNGVRFEVAPYRNARLETLETLETGNVNVGPPGREEETPHLGTEAANPTPEEVAEWERLAKAAGQSAEVRTEARLRLADWRGRQAREGQPERPKAEPTLAQSQGKPRTKGRALLADLSRQSTAEQVDDAARALAAELRDEHSVLMYRKVLGEVVAGTRPLRAVQAAYRMAKSPTTEKPGARFVGELKSQEETSRDKAKTAKRQSQRTHRAKRHP